MPDESNVAYSEEYRQMRSEYDWLFATEPEEEESFSLDVDTGYRAVCLSYSQTHYRPGGMTVRLAGKKVQIVDRDGGPVFDYKIIDDHLLLKTFRHRNGRDYLLFSIDLYGYSVLDLQSRESAHYVPGESFKGGETFIWVDAAYCPVNSLLAVDGCYWACPWSMQFYDFTNPMQVPLPCYCDSFILEDESGVDIDSDVRAVRFTDAGECIIQCKNSRGEDTEMVVDIAKRFKNGSCQ